MLSDRLQRKKRRVLRKRGAALAAAPSETPLVLEGDGDPAPLTRLVVEGFTLWCDGYRAAGNMLIFISVFGVQTSVRAAWAIASKDRLYISIGEESFSLADVRYSMVRTPLAHQYLHCVMLHPAATSLVSPFGGFFYVIGERPEEQFWTRFNRMCQVPVRQSWREEVWKLGIEKTLIQPLDGLGPIQGYMVNIGSEGAGGWIEVIRDAVKAGRLK